MVARSNGEFGCGMMDAPSRDVPPAHELALKKSDHDAVAKINQVYRSGGRSLRRDHSTVGNLAKAKIEVSLYTVAHRAANWPIRLKHAMLRRAEQLTKLQDFLH